MNSIVVLKKEVQQIIAAKFSKELLQDISCDLTINFDQGKSFGDLSCPVAMQLARKVKQPPREVATVIKDALLCKSNAALAGAIKDVEIAGPGFVNITLQPSAWALVASEVMSKKTAFYALPEADRKKILIEFVSVNPTGPMHHGHARGAIVGDVLSRVADFLGHDVTKEYYINDAGNQIVILGRSFQARCKQVLGYDEPLPDGGYAGEYLLDLAEQCVNEFGSDLLNKEESFFARYAKDHMLQIIKHDLDVYGISFDRWFSEKSLHQNGEVDESLLMLNSKGFVYESEGALWFKSTEFGDDKDRVLRKKDGEVTYIAPDIAYHKNKFDRGYDRLINVFGQDHHGYVKRLKATLSALGYDEKKLHVILVQLVTFKESEVTLKMSKRAGKFVSLQDVVEFLGSDVARFFYLNRKPEAHLDFDLQVAVKTTDENPVFYIQYAYVRTKSVLNKAREEKELASFIAQIGKAGAERLLYDTLSTQMTEAEITLIKKIVSLSDIARSVVDSHQTHVIAYYAWELANHFHGYYAQQRVIDPGNKEATRARLCIVALVRQSLELCLDLLGLSKPESM